MRAALILAALVFVLEGCGRASPAAAVIPSPSPTAVPTPASLYPVAGVVFYDENANGTIDPGEEVRLPHVVLTLGGRSTESDGAGSFAASDVPAGTRTVEIRAQSLPPQYRAGRVPTVSIPLPDGARVPVPVVLPIGGNRPNVYLAFGDSITAGEITVIGEGGVHTLQVIPSLSWPADLRALLASRYTSQQIDVLNQGVKGEITSFGLARLPSVLGSYQVLLLMEGANDINEASDAAVLTALSNMRAMVRLARARGLRVFLATLPPQNPLGCFSPCRAGGAAQLPSYNLGLRAIAASENVSLVDAFAAFTDVPTQIGPDGLHPTALGYQKIAATFFDAIRSSLEIAPTSHSPFSQKTPFFAVPWRR